MSKKLMIVDDSRVVYASMSKMLENSGWEIAQFCRSGEEALKTYPDIQPDVVTMDIVMPKGLHSPMLWVQRVSSTSRSIGKSS